MNQQLKTELEALAVEAKARGETLKAEAVVAWAKAHPESEAHGEFEWDDSEAAHKYRLQQGNQLIRVYVKVIPAVGNHPVRALTHLPSDKSGYRRTEDVISNPMWRSELVNEALAKVGRLRHSFACLPELEPFWVRLDQLAADFRVELQQVKKTG